MSLHFRAKWACILHLLDVARALLFMCVPWILYHDAMLIACYLNHSFMSLGVCYAHAHKLGSELSDKLNSYIVDTFSLIILNIDYCYFNLLTSITYISTHITSFEAIQYYSESTSTPRVDLSKKCLFHQFLLLFIVHPRSLLHSCHLLLHSDHCLLHPFTHFCLMCDARIVVSIIWGPSSANK